MPYFIVLELWRCEPTPVWAHNAIARGRGVDLGIPRVSPWATIGIAPSGAHAILCARQSFTAINPGRKDQTTAKDCPRHTHKGTILRLFSARTGNLAERAGIHAGSIVVEHRMEFCIAPLTAFQRLRKSAWHVV